MLFCVSIGSSLRADPVDGLSLDLIQMPRHSAGLRRPVPCTADTSETTTDQDLLDGSVSTQSMRRIYSEGLLLGAGVQLYVTLF